MRFVYCLAGWPGSADDSRILRDAVTRADAFSAPAGKLGVPYLCLSSSLEQVTEINLHSTMSFYVQVSTTWLMRYSLMPADSYALSLYALSFD
ncbi:hypothetical protein LINGRAHAP2_LOCUS7942 [Linum grandiflorum]